MIPRISGQDQSDRGAIAFSSYRSAALMSQYYSLSVVVSISYLGKNYKRSQSKKMSLAQ